MSGNIRPAGCSSSEDDDDDDEYHHDDEDKVFRLPPSSFVRCDKSSSWNAAKPALPLCNDIVWSKNTCATRIDKSPPTKLSTDHVKQLTPLEMQFSSNNNTNFKTHETSTVDEVVTYDTKRKSSAESSKNERKAATDLDWIEQKLNEDVKNLEIKSKIPKGSIEVDDDWLIKICKAWNKKTKKDTTTFPTTVFECLQEVVNPYTTSLYIMENLNLHVTGKKPQMLNAFLNVLRDWLNENPAQHFRCLDDHVQLRAFAFIVRVSSIYSLDLVVKCFYLDKIMNTDQYIAIIKHLLKKYEFLKASRCIAALSLQNHFTMNEVCFPLLLQGHTGHEIEDYLLGNHSQQVAFVQLLDGLINPETNFDVLFGKFVDVPKIRRDQMTSKNLLKIATRLIQLYQISQNLCPNVSRQTSRKSLHYLIYRKYVHNDIGHKQWEEIVRAHVSDDEFLQMDLINKLIEFDDCDEVAKFVDYFDISRDKLPSAFLNWLEYNSSRSSESLTSNVVHGEHGRKSEEKSKESENIIYHDLQLSLDSVHWVENEDEFMRCVEHLKLNGPTVGLDTEWRPYMGNLFGSRMALLQLAVKNSVFLLDMISLINCLNDDLWKRLAEDVLCNPQLITLGYGLDEDLILLIKTAPILKDYTDQMRTIDFMRIHNVIRRDSSTFTLNVSSDGVAEEVIVKTEERFVGLSDLVKFCVGRPLDKSQQMSNWERRPLRTEQISYAALDAYCLLEVYDVLKENCVRLKIDKEFLISGKSFIVKKTKLEKKQEKIQRHSTVNSNELQQSVDSVDAGVEKRSPSQLRIVCDNMLTGLGRYLRRCGVDVRLVNSDDSHEKAAEIGRKEGRILLTAGNTFYTLKRLIPSSLCYQVVSKEIQDQVTEVIRHFKVTVKPEDVFSRCQICNNDDYLRIHPNEMKAAWIKKKSSNSRDLPHIKFESSSSNEAAIHPTQDDKINPSNEDDFDCLNLETMKLENGANVLVDNIPIVKFDQVQEFYVCSNCGKVYWEGMHRKNMEQKLSLVLETHDSAK